MLIQYDIDLLNIWIHSLKYISMIQKNSIQESLSISAPTKHNFTYFTQFTESFPWVGCHQTSTTTLKAGACRDEFTTLKEYKLPLSWSKSSCYTCPLPLCCSATQRPAKQVAQRFCFGRSNLWYSNSWTGHYALIALANRFPRILPRPWKNNYWMHVLEMCSTTFDICQSGTCWKHQGITCNHQIVFTFVKAMERTQSTFSMPFMTTESHCFSHVPPRPGPKKERIRMVLVVASRISCLLVISRRQTC